jgi:tetratricopeptide (TPR) repeat protein
MSRWVELQNRAVELMEAGDVANALAACESALELAVSDEERASTLLSFSTAMTAVGDRERAVDLLAEAEALNTSSQPLVRNAIVGHHTAWAGRFLATGQFGEAATEAQMALELVYQDAPDFAPSVHIILAEIADATGDQAGCAEHYTLARDLSAATQNTPLEATSLLSLARLAYLKSDLDQAEALYDQAEKLLLAMDNQRALAVCVHGRAAVKNSRGEPRVALELLKQVVCERPTELVAYYQVKGGALEQIGDYAQADECYGKALEVCEQYGVWHVAIGIAWWRADALVRWASTVDGVQRAELSRRALDLALPAALAAEAVRQRFAHGSLRERWVALATAPATRSAFHAISAVGDVRLASEYIDHVTGTVSLQAGPALVREELLSFPEPPSEPETCLPFAASFVATTGSDPEFPATGFALPPRVRADPAVRSTLDSWIDLAEQRYGFRVRSDLAVASW